MATAKKLEPEKQVVSLQLPLVHESPTNPRKTFKPGTVEELAESIKKHGLLHPVTARPEKDGEGYELVIGERRRRACVHAKLEEILAFVRNLSDEEVVEIQIVENAQREDVPPLEEADHYAILTKPKEKGGKYGYSVDEVATRVGKKPRLVHERLQLVKLCAEGRKALEEERLLLGVACLIARIPGEDLQKRATIQLAARTKSDAPTTFGDAVHTIQTQFMHGLKDAPFKLTDAELVPAAGPCSTCPKRTGNQRELFPDVKSPDVCTDPKCYRGKEEALWQLRVADARESGQKVLGAAEAKKLYPYGDHSMQGPYVELDGNAWVAGKNRSIASIVGKEVKPVLVRTPEQGKIVQLVPREVYEKAVKKLEPKSAIGRASTSSGPSMDTLNRRKLEVRKAVIAVATPKIVEAMERETPDLVLRFVAQELLDGGHHDSVQALGKRRGLEARKQSYGGDSYDKALRDLIGTSSAADLQGIIVELLVAGNPAGGTYSDSFTSSYQRGAKFAGVDLKKLQAAAKKEKDAAKKKPGKKAKK